MAEQQGMVMREYRKGNWTVQETMILIEAKKMDDERRKQTKKQTYNNQNIITTNTNTTTTTTTLTTTLSSPSSSSSPSTSISVRPVTELRWKWVEEYCWRKGCLRSQNQCNDKWDNLMRDYKKIRDFQRGLLSGDYEQISTSGNGKSYWEMDKVERKDKGLPTNMLPQIYQALFDVVEQSTVTTTTTATATATAIAAATTAGSGSVVATQFLQLPPPMMLSSPPTLRLQTTQLPFYSPLPQQQQPHLLSTLESEASEHSQPESSAKRRRKEERVIPSTVEGTSIEAPQPQPPTTTTTTTTAPLQEVSSAICRSASIIAEAIKANEEKQERRHKEIMHIHETRLRIEESKLEVTRQGFNGLSEAINKLATSIFTWASNNSHKSQQGP